MTSSGRQLIDWHTHCWLPEHSSAEQQATMKAHGVIGGQPWPEEHQSGVVEQAEKFVVISPPNRHARSDVNDFVAEYVSRFPGRAVGLACVDPNDAGADAEFERCVTKLGLKGLKLSPVYQGFDPWTASAWRLYEIANARHMPVMFHMGGAFDPEASLEWGSPLLLDRVGRAFPDLRIIVAHLGQPMMQETVMLMRKNHNVFADLSARYHRKWQLYNGLQFASEYKVTDRLLFGSDFPVMSSGAAAEAFRGINDFGEGVSLPRIPAEVIDGILYGRPFELFGW
jgi:predicted TIM-barrel fold metal-dependent hydrolase